MGAEIIQFRRPRRVPTGTGWVDQYEEEMAAAADDIAQFVEARAAGVSDTIDIKFMSHVLLGCAAKIIEDLEHDDERGGPAGGNGRVA